MSAATTDLVWLCRDEDCPECGWPETFGEAKVEDGGVHLPHALVCKKCGWRRELDPVDAAVNRLCNDDVTIGSTPCPPALADALADLLLDCESVARDTGSDMRGNPQRVARAVLGWLS